MSTLTVGMEPQTGEKALDREEPSSPVVIRVEGLSKSYRIGENRARRTLREAIMAMPAAPWRRARKLWTPTPEVETFWAVRDVSFEIRRGEA